MVRVFAGVSLRPALASIKRGKMKSDFYIPLEDSPIDPQKAKYAAFALSAAAALIALFTWKSNLDYFGQHYEDYALYVRVIVFSALEVAMICLPITLGWGNWSQVKIAFALEVILIPCSLVHTNLVGESIHARAQAAATKSSAISDVERAQAAAREIIESNERAQRAYNVAMINWRSAVNTALRNGLPAPAQPTSPQLAAVPQVKQEAVDNSLLSVETVTEKAIPHAWLTRLLHFMLTALLIGIALLAKFADASRVRLWLLKKNKKLLDAVTRQAAPEALPEQTGENLESRRVAGFSQGGFQSGRQSVKRSGRQSVRFNSGIIASPTEGGYSLKSDRGQYLCYLPEAEAARLSGQRAEAILSEIQRRVEARREGGNKAAALAELARMKA